MKNNFMRVDEVMNALGVSKSFAYKTIRELNNELKDKGKIVVNGRISRKYFEERMY